ncbi:hypothetical protein GRJ2_002246900 [Grus japonensis]|uniref:Uncharacterized protein n=1 Tax=Grus japonensis TaxID=30415 RepID=A0ABC9XJI7_GRUJA
MSEQPRMNFLRPTWSMTGCQSLLRKQFLNYRIAHVNEGSERAALVGTWPPARVNPPQLVILSKVARDNDKVTNTAPWEQQDGPRCRQQIGGAAGTAEKLKISTVQKSTEPEEKEKEAFTKLFSQERQQITSVGVFLRPRLGGDAVLAARGLAC